MITLKENPAIVGIREINRIPDAIQTITQDGQITKTDLAKYLGVGRDTLWQWEKQNYHPPYVLARALFLLEEAVKQQRPSSSQ